MINSKNEKYPSFCTFFIFFGCGSTGSLNNELNVKVPFSTKNIFPLLKILRKYELIKRLLLITREKKGRKY